MTKLSELEPIFLIREDNTHFRCVPDLAGADGIEFLCPKCFKERGNSKIGCHAIICWSPHISQDTGPTPGRWEMKGTGLNDLSLVAGSSSILIKGGCQAHFFITNGEIVEA